MSTTSRRLILGFALLGLAFAGTSAWVHYKLLTDPSYQSLCDYNNTFNCSQVYMSRFGAVAGVPVAVGGIIWFGLVALMAGLPRLERRDGDPTGAYVFALATVGLASILYLGYASFFILQKACVLCIGTYVSVAGIFIVSGTAASTSVARLPTRLPGDIRAMISRPTTFLIALLFLVGAGSLVTVFPKEGNVPQGTAPTQDQAKFFEEAWWQQPRVDLGIPADGAKVVVVKFNDYQCPTCKAVYDGYRPVYQKFEESHPGQVKQVTKDWPWHSKCNFNVPTEMHNWACEAAAAARMARDRGKLAEMEAFLFENQSTLTPQGVIDGTKKLLGVTDFDKEYAARLPDIKRDIADGGALSLQGTPLIFINGVRINGYMQPSLFELALSLELNKKAAPRP
jgi:vitamin-K-epoxide reductase (warfarin-sensitive)